MDAYERSRMSGSVLDDRNAAQKVTDALMALGDPRSLQTFEHMPAGEMLNYMSPGSLRLPRGPQQVVAYRGTMSRDWTPPREYQWFAQDPMLASEFMGTTSNSRVRRALLDLKNVATKEDILRAQRDYGRVPTYGEVVSPWINKSQIGHGDNLNLWNILDPVYAPFGPEAAWKVRRALIDRGFNSAAFPDFGDSMSRGVSYLMFHPRDIRFLTP